MAFELQFFGATERVTGSLYLLRAGDAQIVLECGLVQGAADEEAHNREPFPFDLDAVDAVVISTQHLETKPIDQLRRDIRRYVIQPVCAELMDDETQVHSLVTVECDVLIAPSALESQPMFIELARRYEKVVVVKVEDGDR